MQNVSKSLPINTKPINPYKLLTHISPFTKTTKTTHHKTLTKFTIPSLIKNFAITQDLLNGRKTHAITLQMGLQSDPFIASSLISLYFKCHSPLDAHQVFAQLPHRDSTIWNSMLNGYFQCSEPHKALFLLREMQLSGFKPDGHSLTILLKGTSDGHLSLDHGKQAHAYVVTNGLEFDPYLVTALIDMYSKCGDIVRAFKVFDGSFDKSISMWNAMIVGFYRHNMWERSLELFAQMRFEHFVVESATVSSVLMACSIGEAADFGEGVHCCVVKMGLELYPYVSNTLVVMYGKLGFVDDAERVFYGVADKRIELWNAIASVYTSRGLAYEALDVYNQMRLNGILPDSITVSNVLSACSLTGFWEFGTRIHGDLVKRPQVLNMAVVQSSLITMYMKSGIVESATALFASTKDRDLVTWGSMIVGFCQNQNFDHALDLFNQLRAEELSLDATIIASTAAACTGLEFLELGCQIHCHAIKIGTNDDQLVGSALIDMYSKLGLPQLAGKTFSFLPYKNLVVLNSMISGYSRNGLLNESVSTFSEITGLGLVPDQISITSVLASVPHLQP